MKKTKRKPKRGAVIVALTCIDMTDARWVIDHMRTYQILTAYKATIRRLPARKGGGA